MMEQLVEEYHEVLKTFIDASMNDLCCIIC